MVKASSSSSSKHSAIASKSKDTKEFKSLEQALNDAGNKFTSVDESTKENIIVIDRTLYSNRKKSKISTVTSSIEKIKDFPLLTNTSNDSKSDIHTVNEVKFWKDKYEQLRECRLANEEDMEKQLILASDKEMKLMKYIQLLEQKVGNNVVEATAVTATPATTTTTTNDHDEQIRTLQKQNDLYKTMTCMSVKVCDADDAANNRYTCTVKNNVKRMATRFQVTLNSDETIELEPTANSSMLPSYLREGTITFDANAAPVVMGDILNNLFDYEDGDQQ